MFAGCLGFGLICRLGSSYVTFIQVVTSNRITLSPPPKERKKHLLHLQFALNK